MPSHVQIITQSTASSCTASWPPSIHTSKQEDIVETPCPLLLVMLIQKYQWEEPTFLKAKDSWSPWPELFCITTTATNRVIMNSGSTTTTSTTHICHISLVCFFLAFYIIFFFFFFFFKKKKKNWTIIYFRLCFYTWLPQIACKHDQIVQMCCLPKFGSGYVRSSGNILILSSDSFFNRYLDLYLFEEFAADCDNPS